MDEFPGRRTFFFILSAASSDSSFLASARLGGMEQRMKQITANWLAGLGICGLLCISEILELLYIQQQGTSYIYKLLRTVIPKMSIRILVRPKNVVLATKQKPI